MATSTYIAGNSFVIARDGASDGASITLAGAAPGRAQMINAVSVKALGTVSVVDIVVTKNDTSTLIAKWGATSTLPVGGAVWALSGPICCAANDNAVVSFNLTGATGSSVAATVHYTLAQA